jgi:predicted transport protein
VSLKVALSRIGKTYRFPTDTEFQKALENRNVYEMRTCAYFLDRLENDSKEQYSTSKLTIEHVLPQNEKLSPEWQSMLGNDWKEIQQTWVQRLGNITLTGYNPEYSDRSFEEKKTMEKGFNDSSVSLNVYIRQQTKWTPIQIEERGTKLAKQAVNVWPSLRVDQNAVRQDELSELQARAKQYNINSIGLDSEARKLFDALQPQIMALAPDIIQLCGIRTVVYRVYDYFLEIIPRTKYILLLINIDYVETDDPTKLARDASDFAFITHASESGGVVISLKDMTQIPAAMHIIQQAYERITE